MQQPHNHWQRVTWISALSTFLILLTISAAGLTYYAAVARPAALSTHTTAVAQAFLAAQAQSTSPQYIYQQATRGKPAINDPLSDSSTSAWNKASQYQANCSYQDGAYHVLVGAQPTVGTCTSELKSGKLCVANTDDHHLRSWRRSCFSHDHTKSETLYILGLFMGLLCVHSLQ